MHRITRDHWDTDAWKKLFDEGSTVCPPRSGLIHISRSELCAAALALLVRRCYWPRPRTSHSLTFYCLVLVVRCCLQKLKIDEARHYYKRCAMSLASLSACAECQECHPRECCAVHHAVSRWLRAVAACPEGHPCTCVCCSPCP